MGKIILYIAMLGLLTVSCQRMEKTINSSKKDFSSAMRLTTSEWDSLFASHQESAIYHRRFKHQDIDSLVQLHAQRGILQVERIGTSAAGRSISELTYGDGSIKVMLWSQMHGDEPTATMALLDIFNFLEGQQDDGADSLRDLLKSKLQIHFIPMLNPDGAEIYNRRNVQSIDLNRDARAKQTVEGKLLTARADAVKPSFGFNLHDQSIYYHVPETQNPVTISLLAPAYNEAREINETRGNAMKLIAGINKMVQQYQPEAVAKYDDTHSPRGFGDNFQKWGAATVLIESGGLKGDVEKQQIRKINFIIILNALMEIAQGSYEQYEIAQYDDIPFNGSSLLHDVFIRNLEIGSDSVPLRTDIAIRRAENTVDRDFFVRGWVEDLGDLQESFGYDQVDASQLHFVQGRISPKVITSVNNLSKSEAFDLLKQGYMAIRLQPATAGNAASFHNLPIQLFTQPTFYLTSRIDLGGTANFYLADDSGRLLYAVLNGYLIDLNQPLKETFKNKVL
ncbi:peptidase M14 [Sphingobacterium sp. lm-10]|uniref:M14 family zinc carboxypeptidase n=1 Tax=Sphingobacterium sp. lm-10 TaxID=2944904 RepID=UPI0020222DAC|nr:M14 family zinc carboxypeptidase [Sphingobacterium sp. lm-10]MCL7988934.1 peptidase M14 [Sphingobacterium sp. lm-10]